MAGESPDRSKQQKSSGDPASSDGHDPRLAVAREDYVRVDRPTAVFATRTRGEASSTTARTDTTASSNTRRPTDSEAVTPSSSDDSAGAGVPGIHGSRGSGSSEASEGRSAADGAEAAGDARLRAAVAAWVTSGDAAETAEAAEDSTGSVGTAGDSAGDEAATADDATDGGGLASGDAAPASGGQDAPDADADAGVDAGVDVDVDVDAGASTNAGAEGSGSGSDAGSGSGGAREAAAPSGAEPAGQAQSVAQGADERASAPGAAGTVTSEDRADHAAEAGDETQQPAADAGPTAPVADDSARNAGTRRDAEADSPANAGVDSDSVDDAPSRSGTPSDADADADADAEDADDANDADDRGDSGPAVDQATAVFRAVRPPVDQPTTMLKIGGRKPGGAAADGRTGESRGDEKRADGAQGGPGDRRGPGETGSGEASRSAGRPQVDAHAERTSKFVALKPLDEPAVPNRPSASASTAPAAPFAPAPAVPGHAAPERTAQQPLPPKPPLDLLAELTNTPPPPQTPVRTLVRRIKIWTPLVVLLAIVFAVAQAVRPLPSPSLVLAAEGTYTFEGSALDLPWPGQGQSAIEVGGVGSLGTEGAQNPAPIASVAKIMTAYVILQEHPLKGDEGGEKITVDQQAADESGNADESTAPLAKGQQFTERQMLQLLMIPSGNNAARLLARWDSSNDEFVAKMNAAAKKLGMPKTTYTDPSGLDSKTVSTATDQLKLAKAVMQNEVFRSIVVMAQAKIPGVSNTIINNNDLLVTQPGVLGIKTGSSTPAGGNLVWAATKTVDGKAQTIYGAVLGQQAGTGRVWDSLQLALANSKKLINAAQQSLTSATVVKKGQVVGYVDDQLGGKTPVVATENMTAVGWPGLKAKISIGDGGKTVPHSGRTGTTVGELTVGDGSSYAVKIPVALQGELKEPGFGVRLTRLG